MSVIVFRKHIRKFAAIMALIVANEIIFPNIAFALTGGPSQPEVQSFEPVGTSDMVDLFSGDFNYNIPLLDVGGYPINIAYHAGPSMDEEASWVGLGWNLNPGVINRNMRGIPDDFGGGADQIKKEQHLKPNVTVGTNPGTLVEIFGLPKSFNKASSLGLSIGITNNNYRGWGVDVEFSPELNTGKFLQSEMTFGFSSSEGLSVDANISLPFNGINGEQGGGGAFNIGSGINSRSGLKSLNLGMSANIKGYNPSTGRAVDTKYGGSTSWNFGTQTYTTKITSPQRQFGMSLKMSSGSEIFGLHGGLNVSGSFSVSQANSESVLPAYGFMYEDQKKLEKNPNEVLLDFNRENDNGLNDRSTNLPLTNHTFDIYSVSGQGVGGSYRTYRGDVGIVHDHTIEYGSFSGSLGAEFGVGNLAHTGANLNGTYTKTSYGPWEDENGLYNKFGFVEQREKPYTGYESFYFKPAGELTIIDETQFNNIKGVKAIRADINPIIGNSNGLMVAKGDKTSAFNPTGNITFSPKGQPIDNAKNNRDPRNKVMSVLTNNESRFCFENNIYSVPHNEKYTQQKINATPLDLSNRPKHHVREVSITNEDGSRYIYGIPAYNNLQIERTFNISKKDNSHLNGNVCVNGQATYAPNDDSRNNRNGEDEYFSSTETPAYAHSYLLTSVVSPDYVDVKSDGITDDDLGTAVKFNYTRVHDQYRWRTPYGNRTASYQEGIKSKRTDDKGSYVYGTKEMWHMHSIESKNQVALFITSQREDALGVLGPEGGKDLSQRSYKLDRIELYNKQDLINNPTTAEPIKIVYFEYDYSLCPNVDNNSGATVAGNESKGKLTLKKIYFSYGKSNKGKFSPYRFKYSDFNPSYNMKANDMWGTYKPAPVNATCDWDGPLLNNEFPYTTQSKTEADQYASAWCLSEVFLPSGGSIKVEYESDDYAFVQNRNAMQMFQIEGFGKVTNGNLDAPIHNREFLHKINNGIGLHQNALLFKLPSTISTGSSSSDKQKLFNEYLKNIKDLQVNVFVNIDGNNTTNNYEYVKCYVEPDLNLGYGVIDGGNTGWIGLKTTNFGDKRADLSEKINPVSRAVWNHTRLNCDFLVNPQMHLDDSNDPSKAKGKILSMVAIHRDILSLFAGYNKTLFLRGFGSKIKSAKSWVRLNSPTKFKYGGGHRVKKILINDNWSEMGAANNNASDMEYGQEYTYTTEENGAIISSGVASYEPQFSEENPFKLPRTLTIENKMVPNEMLLIEEPIGESFYPGAGIGYSKVTVKNIGKTNVNRTGTGKEVSEFYTAKDFPTIVSETDIRIEKLEPPKIFQLFKISVEKTISATQGYTIELNDMHGKPKKKMSYREGSDKPFAGSEYLYKTETNNTSKLSNVVPVIMPNGQISDKTVGLDFDVIHDMNEYKTTSTTGGAEVNMDNMYVILSVLTIPAIYPSYKRNKIKVRTAVTTKVINRYAVLEKTIAYQEGSSIETQNRLWDGITGQVLLSSVQNEFKDNVYNFNYPAHWSYDGMGPAYKNIGLILNSVQLTQKNIFLPGNLDPKNFLVPGDEVAIYPAGPISWTQYGKRAWVYDGADGKLNLIDDEGYPIVRNNSTRLCNLKVIRSGRRNMQSTPVGSVTSLSNPINGSTLNFTNVLNAEAAEFSDNWQTHIDYIQKFDCGENFTDTGQEILNLFDYFASNDKFKKYFYISNRTSSMGDLNDTVYQNNSGSWVKIGTTGTGTGMAVITDTCNQYQVELSNKNNDLVGMQHGRKYYSVSPVDLYTLRYEYTNNDQHLYDNITNTWTPSWMGTSKLKDKFGLSASHWRLKAIDDYKMEIWINDLCIITLESDKPFTSISDFMDMIAINNHTFSGSAIIKGQDCVNDTAQITINVPCLNISDCEWDCRNVFVEGPINPYKTNMRGVWRPKRSLKYLDNRNYQGTTVNTRTDGVYSSYSPYWLYNSGTNKFEPQTNNNKWIWSTEVTKYSPFGPEVETKDALGNYSAALYAYNYTHPVAVASNSRYNQLAFDGFEDYNYMNIYEVSICPNNHFNFKDAVGMAKAEITAEAAHSGKHSIKVFSGQTADYTRQLSDISVTTYNGYSEDVSRIAKQDDNLGYFAPQPGEYIVGAWVNSQNRQGDTTIVNSYIKITLTDTNNNSTSVSLLAKGNIIEGWQRIEEKITIPAGTKYFKLELISGEQNAYFDDIRIHPAAGNMASYVYDNRTLRLMAELDANNYATFYEYSLEGELVRVKKETIKGIQTLKEVRASSIKKPHNGIFNP